DDGDIGCVACHRGAHHDKVSDDACAVCHVVTMPPSFLARYEGDPLRGPPPLAQVTPHEIREGAPSCSTRHFEGHRYPGGHDADVAGRAVSLTVERSDDA